MSYVTIVAALFGFAARVGAASFAFGAGFALVIFTSLVIEGIAFAIYLGWRSVIRGWRTEIGKAQGSSEVTESLPSLGRELGTTEIVVQSLRLFKKNFRIYVVPFVASALAIGMLDEVVQAIIPIQMPQNIPPLSGFIESPSALIESVVFIALTSPISALVDGMGVSITVDSLGQEGNGLRRSYAAARSKFRQLWGVVILTGIILDLAASVPLVALIPEIVFFVVVPVVMIEGKPTLSALKRSWQLTKKRWTAVFGLLFASGLITVGPSLVFYYATASQSSIEILVSETYAGLVAPILICMSVVFYYSSKARLNAPSLATSVQQSQHGAKRWICRNCGTSVIMVSTPSQQIFGGCLKAKRGWLESVGKHDWEAMQFEASPNRGNYCPNCGKPLDPLDKFCRSCGHAVGKTEVRSTSTRGWLALVHSVD